MIKRTLLFSNPVYLSTRDDQLLVDYPDQGEKVARAKRLKVEPRPGSKSVPIEDIGVMILEDPQITITNGAIRKLIANNVAMIYCDEKHMPVGSVLPTRGHSEQSERFQLQITASQALKKNLWKQLIEAKIRNQAAVLQYNAISHQHLKYLSQQVLSGDTSNVEARAAAYYWDKIFRIEHFTRQRFGAPPNNLLNYGYAVLRAVVSRALMSSGLFPTFGIHHKNKYNAFCLADDIMEPYRPYVDQLVIEIMDEESDIEELTTSIKRKLLQIPVLDIVIEGKRSPLLIGVSRTTNSLYECYAKMRRTLLLPKFQA